MRLTLPRRAISAAVRASMRAAEDRTLAQTKKMAQDTLAYAAKVSPQWTGTFAANWRLAINKSRPGNSNNEVATDAEREVPQASERDSVAVNTAINSSGSRLSRLKVGDRIYLSTVARNQDGDEYHWDVEGGLIRFRKDNPTARANKGRILELAKAHLRAQYAGKIR